MIYDAIPVVRRVREHKLLQSKLAILSLSLGIYRFIIRVLCPCKLPISVMGTYHGIDVDIDVCRYMAKAPTTAAAFDGSGQVWFKILDIGPTFTNQVATWNLYREFCFSW